MTYAEALRKRRIETALARPIVFLGKLFSRLFRPKGKHRLFLFSSPDNISGSIVSNVDLCKMFLDLFPIVIFNKQSKTEENAFDFFQVPGITTWNIYGKIDHKQKYLSNFFYRGVIAAWINSTPNPVVIGGDSLYFYKILPWINKEVKTIERCPSNTWIDYSLQFVSDLNARVFSTQKLKREVDDFYNKNKIASVLKTKLFFIENMVPDLKTPIINNHNQLQVIFIVQKSLQNRIYLSVQTAKKIYDKDLPIHFSFVGDVTSEINTHDYPYCTFYGKVEEQHKLNKILEQSDVLLVLAQSQNISHDFQLMMMLGKVVVATTTNAAAEYIKDGINGFLIPDDNNDKMIVEDGIIAISILGSDFQTREEMGKRNYKLASDRFNPETFRKKWSELIRQL